MKHQVLLPFTHGVTSQVRLLYTTSNRYNVNINALKLSKQYEFTFTSNTPRQPKQHFFLCSVQVTPACPSDKNRTKVKMSMMHWGNNTDRGKPEVLGEKPFQMSLCPPQILPGLTRDRTLASAVPSQRWKTRSSKIQIKRQFVPDPKGSPPGGLLVLGYDAAPLGNRLLTFRRNIVPSKHRKSIAQWRIVIAQEKVVLHHIGVKTLKTRAFRLHKESSRLIMLGKQSSEFVRIMYSKMGKDAQLAKDVPPSFTSKP
jgi:hypothetical protein